MIDTDIRKHRYKLIKGLFWGVLAIIAAFMFVFSFAGNPYHEYLLMTKGITTKATITNIDEDVEARDAGGNTYYYDYSFNFNLPDGQNIKSSQTLSGGNAQETPDLPSTVDVIYLRDKPEVNKIKNTLSDSLFEFLWRKIGLGTLLLITFSSIGIIIIRHTLKEYSAKMKNTKK